MYQVRLCPKAIEHTMAQVVQSKSIQTDSRCIDIPKSIDHGKCGISFRVQVDSISIFGVQLTN